MTKRTEQIKKEDKKAWKSFLLIILISGFCGGIIGFCISFFSEDILQNGIIEVLSAFWNKYVGMVSSILLFVLNLVVFILIELRGRKAGKLLKEWDQEDNEYYERVDKMLSVDLMLITVIKLLNLILIGMALYNLRDMDLKETLRALATTVVFLAASFIHIHYQKNIVNLIKEYNPEKKGSVYDKKFQKKWLESCDEAEKAKIGEASYRSYRKMNNVYTIVLLVVIVAGYSFSIGRTPLLLTGGLFLVNTIIFLLEGIKV